MVKRIVYDPNTGASQQIDYTPPPAPPPTYIPPTATLSSVAQFTLTDGDISNIDISAGFSFVMVIAPGIAWALFEVAMPSLSYTWNVNSTEGEVRVTDGRTIDYVEISLKDDNGDPLQTGTIALQIFKVN